MLFAFLCTAICQEQSSVVRAREAVETIAIPAQMAGMPATYKADRILRLEAKQGVPDDEEPPKAVGLLGPVHIQQLAVTSPTFDAWVFGNMKGEEQRARWVEMALKDKLVLVGAAHDLSRTELAKLHLAGRGDVKRLFAEIEEKREGFEAVRTDVRLAQKSLKALDSTCERFEFGPFNEGSLFSKTLAKILDDRN